MNRKERRTRQLIKAWLTPQERSLYYSLERIGNVVPLSFIIQMHGALHKLATVRRAAYIASKQLAKEHYTGQGSGLVAGPDWLQKPVYHSLAFRRYAMNTIHGGTPGISKRFEWEAQVPCSE